MDFLFGQRKASVPIPAPSTMDSDILNFRTAIDDLGKAITTNNKSKEIYIGEVKNLIYEINNIIQDIQIKISELKSKVKNTNTNIKDLKQDIKTAPTNAAKNELTKNCEELERERDTYKKAINDATKQLKGYSSTLNKKGQELSTNDLKDILNELNIILNTDLNGSSSGPSSDNYAYNNWKPKSTTRDRSYSTNTSRTGAEEEEVEEEEEEKLKKEEEEKLKEEAEKEAETYKMAQEFMERGGKRRKRGTHKRKSHRRKTMKKGGFIAKYSTKRKSSKKIKSMSKSKSSSRSKRS